MNADQRPTDETPYETPEAEDVDLVAGVSETAPGNVSTPSGVS
jgi:hypothetical protein